MRLSQNAMKNLLRESKKNVGYHDKETNNTSNNDYSSNKSDLELANKDQELNFGTKNEEEEEEDDEDVDDVDEQKTNTEIETIQPTQPETLEKQNSNEDNSNDPYSNMPPTVR